MLEYLGIDAKYKTKVLRGTEGTKKMANRISHCYDHLPLLPSGSGGVRQELVVSICQCKVKVNYDKVKEKCNNGK